MRTSTSAVLSRREYTQCMIKEGLLNALTTHSFDTLTVSSVAKSAGITRSTFYLHYTNLMEVVDDLLDDAIIAAGEYNPEKSNLSEITKVLVDAKSREELRAAYERIFPQLPLCQRVASDVKYIPVFKDQGLSEYIINSLYLKEKDRQVEQLVKEVNLSRALSESLFLFCVQGLYAVNQQHNWERTDEWLEAQRALFQFIEGGLKSLGSHL